MILNKEMQDALDKLPCDVLTVINNFMEINPKDGTVIIIFITSLDSHGYRIAKSEEIVNVN